MGGKSQQQQTQSSTTRPLAEAMPHITGLLDQLKPQLNNTGLTGNENTALAGLTANAQAGNPYADQIGSLATDLLGGGIDRTGIAQGAYDQLKTSLTPYTTMDTNPYSNEAFTKATSYLSNDITDRIKSQYAGAGYSPVTSGDFSGQLGEGISKGVAPAWLQAYNDMEGRKLGAIEGLYQGGNATAGLLSGLDQTALGNRVAGIDASTAAQTAKDSGYERLLQVEAMKRGLPLQNIAQLESLIIPMAQLGQTTTGQATQTNQMSPAQQAWGWMNAFGNLNRSWGPPTGGG
jgi:hypothetical protein